MRSWLVVAVLSTAIAAAGWYALDRAGGSDPAPTGPGTGGVARVPVSIGTARRANVPVYLTGIGTVQAFNSVLIKPRVDGQIVKVDFAEGQFVHAGDVLAEIDPLPYQAALEQAEAGKLKDEAQLANARLDLSRASRLAASGNVTQQQQDTARSLVAQLEAAVKADQASVDAARLQVNYTRIRSPIDGQAGVRMLDAGNMVRATDSGGIVIINQIRPIYVTFAMPADTLVPIRAKYQAGEVSITAESADSRPLATGQLSVIDNQINPATATIAYKAVFENTNEVLWPGQFVNVRVSLGSRQNVVTVPATAVLHGSEGAYAFIVGPDQIAQKRNVKVAWSDKNVAVIEHGIEVDETVVIDGQSRIEAGTALKPLAPSQVKLEEPVRSAGR